ncbi:MAG TPA: hypothetical protein VLZ83_09135 [Edaphocola sp.]|nr:hypothetical protein [Edaphocola sp.]
MKSILKFSLIALLGLASSSFLSSCKKNGGGGTGSANEGTITFKVNDNKITTLEITTMAFRQSNQLIMQGNTGGTEAKAIAFIIMGFDGEGTYPFHGNVITPNTAQYTETKIKLSDPTNPETISWLTQATKTGETGEITFTEITSTHVKGTFHFNAQNLDDNSIKKITSGAFNVKLNQ